MAAAASASAERASTSFDLGAAAVPGTFISIAGLIGAGKSTLCDKLSELLGLPAYHEAVEDNPYLALFYADKRQYGFALQVHLLTQRFSQQQAIVWSEAGAVQDRSIYEDMVFCRLLNAQGDVSDLDFSTYSRLFSQMSRFMSRPTALVYLDLSPEESLERIRLRARAVEVGITLEYLQALHRQYELFLTEISRTVPVIRIDYSRFYKVEDVARAVITQMQSMGTVHSVTISDPTAPTAREVADRRAEAEAAGAGAAEAGGGADDAGTA